MIKNIIDICSEAISDFTKSYSKQDWSIKTSIINKILYDFDFFFNDFEKVFLTEKNSN